MEIVHIKDANKTVSLSKINWTYTKTTDIVFHCVFKLTYNVNYGWDSQLYRIVCINIKQNVNQDICIQYKTFQYQRLFGCLYIHQIIKWCKLSSDSERTNRKSWIFSSKFITKINSPIDSISNMIQSRLTHSFIIPK